MNIVVRKVDHYKHVLIEYEGVRIDLGLLNENEYRGLANQFKIAISELLPENEDLEFQISTATDLLNTWAREISVEECVNPYKDYNLRSLVDRLWTKCSMSYTKLLDKFYSLKERTT